MKQEIKIAYLFSDLLDFDGTRGDVLYMVHRLQEHGFTVQITDHLVGETIDVREFDFVYAGVCPQKYETLYLTHLKKDVVGLAEYIESGKVMLAVEQSFLFLGKTRTYKKEVTELLQILPFTVEQLDHYAIGNLLLNVQIADFSSKVNGFINTRYQFQTIKGEQSGNAQSHPLGNILLGIDFLWKRGNEGYCYKNFIGTQLRGPVLPRNYDFCDYLISMIVGENVLGNLPSKLEMAAKAKITADCEAFIESGEQKKEYVYVS